MSLLLPVACSTAAAEAFVLSETSPWRGVFGLRDLRLNGFRILEFREFGYPGLHGITPKRRGLRFLLCPGLRFRVYVGLGANMIFSEGFKVPRTSNRLKDVHSGSTYIINMYSN